MLHEKRASRGRERSHYLTSKSCRIRPHSHRRRAPALLPSRPISCDEAFSSQKEGENGMRMGCCVVLWMHWRIGKKKWRILKMFDMSLFWKNMFWHVMSLLPHKFFFPLPEYHNLTNRKWPAGLMFLSRIFFFRATSTLISLWLIGKLTAFLQFQEFSQRNQTWELRSFSLSPRDCPESD
jgi:hypothetical protein